MFKRLGLFVLTNVLVIATIGIILKVFNVQPYLTPYGVNYTQLLIYCSIWGFAGSFISLLLSRFMAKTTLGVKLIEETDPELGWLVRRVYQYAQGANLPKMPEVGIYMSNEVNAFATGPTRSRSLVAVSAGLLNSMNQDEVDGVLAHEIAHIANGDMVTMTLVQGVVNSFALFLSKVIMLALRNNRERRGFLEFFIQQALFSFFSFLGMFVVAGFSRYREFRADEGGARLAGRDKMIAALAKLQNTFGAVDKAKPQIASMKISSRSGLMKLLSTHPPLNDRIEALKSSHLV